MSCRCFVVEASISSSKAAVTQHHDVRARDRYLKWIVRHPGAGILIGNVSLVAMQRLIASREVRVRADGEDRRRRNYFVRQSSSTNNFSLGVARDRGCMAGGFGAAGNTVTLRAMPGGCSRNGALTRRRGPQDQPRRLAAAGQISSNMPIRYGFSLRPTKSPECSAMCWRSKSGRPTGVMP